MASLSCDDDNDDEEYMDWEEVGVDDGGIGGPDSKDEVALNLVLSRGGASARRGPKNEGPSRQVRQGVHRVHTICLLMAGFLRNFMLNNPLLQARLLSLVPLPLINAFSSFSPQTHPLDRDRSRLFDAALKALLSWWWRTFRVDDSFEGMRSRTWPEAERLFETEAAPHSNHSAGNRQRRGKSTANQEAQDPFSELLERGEPIHGTKSLMKRAVMMKGSRDMSAQLFTSLLRALDVPARLVFSLQPVSWRGAGEGKTLTTVHDEAHNEATLIVPSQRIERSLAQSKSSRPKSTLNAVAHQMPECRPEQGTSTSAINDKSAPCAQGGLPVVVTATSSGGEEVSLAQVRPLAVQPPIRLRKSKPARPRHSANSPSPEPAEKGQPPVFWTEVYSRAWKEWYCVDVTRKRMRCKGIMEPSRSSRTNKLLYAVAYEEDHSVRDVTARYAHSFLVTTKKARLTPKEDADWFEQVISKLRRPYKLVRDEKEDEELQRALAAEAMPKTLAGFKNHPNFALENQLRRDEAIFPRKPVGTFRGEPVYSRSVVLACKSAEAYTREGKRIRAGQQPLKMVKPQVVTINRKREQELLKMDGQEIALQGLYADWQTEPIIPPPIKDGIIPRNAYGNFDLFAPHMLPRGAKHLPYKGIAKTAKELRVSYADAVVGFEFRQRRAVPVIKGVIVPEAEAEFILDAYWTSEEAKHEKEYKKIQERCLKRWKKLITGLRIKKRLQEEYSTQLRIVSSPQNSREAVRQLKDLALQPEEVLLASKNDTTTSYEQSLASRPTQLYGDIHVNPMSFSGVAVVDQGNLSDSDHSSVGHARKENPKNYLIAASLVQSNFGVQDTGLKAFQARSNPDVSSPGTCAGNPDVSSPGTCAGPQRADDALGRRDHSESPRELTLIPGSDLLVEQKPDAVNRINRNSQPPGPHPTLRVTKRRRTVHMAELNQTQLPGPLSSENTHNARTRSKAHATKPVAESRAQGAIREKTVKARTSPNKVPRPSTANGEDFNTSTPSERVLRPRKK